MHETERPVISEEMDCDKEYGKPFSNKIRHDQMLGKAESINPFSDDEKEDSLNGKELKESPELCLEFVTGDTCKKGARNSLAKVKE